MWLPDLRFYLCVCASVLALGVQAQTSSSAAQPAAPPQNDPSSTQGSSKKSEIKTSAHTTTQEVAWAALIPPNWNPHKEFEGMDLERLKDGDPRATNLLNRMREVWDQAPINEAMDGALIRIAGYVVPLEGGKDGVKEFLLVPYFGACIHSPPPPANQIIHVLANQAVPGLRPMAAVWVQGKLQAFRHNSLMGVSGYRIEAPRVEVYTHRN
jgi:uncharacterized protein